MSNIEKNKAPVTAFYHLMFNHCKPAEAVEKFSCFSSPAK